MKKVTVCLFLTLTPQVLVVLATTMGITAPQGC
jgi:hypothetical protein